MRHLAVYDLFVWDKHAAQFICLYSLGKVRSASAVSGQQLVYEYELVPNIGIRIPNYTITGHDC